MTYALMHCALVLFCSNSTQAARNEKWPTTIEEKTGNSYAGEKSMYLAFYTVSIIIVRLSTLAKNEYTFV